VSRDVYAPLIEESLKGGIDSGVEGIPTFFINGLRYEDSFGLRTFSETLHKCLAGIRLLYRYWLTDRMLVGPPSTAC
jgi:hypothetical protein